MNEPIDPMKPVASKLTADGVENFTAAGAAGYPILRICVQYLKKFDPKNYELYCDIKDDSLVITGGKGKKTEESRRKAYEFAWKAAGVMIIAHYNRTFTASPEAPEAKEGEEWKQD